MRHPIVFGKYLLLERISVGGMAEVFKAKSFGEEGFEKILAIKQILPSMVQDEEFIEMFIDEAKISGQLSHPNIGQIFELGKIENSYFIAMEYVWGKDVLQIQNRFKRLHKIMPLSMAAFIASRVCEGLDYAHRKKDEQQTPLKIIHRDVSPQNILVSYAGEVKIIDFGIAKARSRSSKTQAGVLKGKFGYMSPEQVRALPMDHRSDVFSIGTILYEMTTGQRLFTGENDFETLEKVRNAWICPPSQLNPNLDPELEKIILKALKRNPDDRYKWASKIQEELTAYLMVKQPIFTSKNLSNQISELFAKERQKELADLEDYKQITIEDVQNLAKQPSTNRNIAVSLIPKVTPNFEQPLASEKNNINNIDKTEISAPSFIEESVDPSNEHLFSTDDLIEINKDQDANITEGKTSIFGDRTGEIADSMLGEPTYIFSVESGKMAPMAEHPTAIFANHSNTQNPSAHIPNQGPNVIVETTPGFGTDDTLAVSGCHKVPSRTLPITIVDASPSVFKDIMIGVLVALVFILGVAVWRVIDVHKAKRASQSTLVITTKPPKAADVYLDGQRRGHINAKTPLMIKNLKPQKYKVRLVSPGVRAVEHDVLLTAGQVKMVSIPLPSPKKPGYLVLKGVLLDAKVFINDEKVALGPPLKPLELSVGKRHEVRIEKKGYQATTYSLTVKSGEKLRRVVELKKLPMVDLVIRSYPSGAKTWIDGEEQGVTPLRIKNITIGQHHLKLSLMGFLTTGDMVVIKDDKKVSSFFFRLKRKVPSINVTQPPIIKTPPQKLPIKKPPSSATTSSSKTSALPKDLPQTPNGQVAPQNEIYRIKDNQQTTRTDKVGYLVTNTTPWAKVFVDGRDTGKTTPVTPRSKITLTPGPHTVTFVADDQKFHFKITINSGQVTRLIKTLPVE